MELYRTHDMKESSADCDRALGAGATGGLGNDEHPFRWGPPILACDTADVHNLKMTAAHQRGTMRDYQCIQLGGQKLHLVPLEDIESETSWPWSLKERGEGMRVIGPAGKFVDELIKAVQAGVGLNGLPKELTRAARVYLDSEPIMLTSRLREWHVVGGRHRILAARLHHQIRVPALL